MVVLAVFLAVNVLFAGVYLVIGIDKLQGTESEMGAFHDLFQPQREANLRTRLCLAEDRARWGVPGTAVCLLRHLPD